MSLRKERANLLQTFMPRNVFVLRYTGKLAQKFWGFRETQARNETRALFLYDYLMDVTTKIVVRPGYSRKSSCYLISI